MGYKKARLRAPFSSPCLTFTLLSLPLFLYFFVWLMLTAPIAKLVECELFDTVALFAAACPMRNTLTLGTA